MPRRLVGFMVLVVALSGCKDAFRARPEIAAEAGGQELKSERLASLMAGIKGVPMSREAAEFISGMWIDQTLFAQAIARGRDLADSATASQVLWPEIAELVGSRWHDTLVARRAPLTAATADSVYNKGDVRLLQHILVRIEPNAEPPAKAAGRKKAESALAQLERGADFTRLAKLMSDDPASKPEGGYLPPAPRGKWVTAFDSAGWTLAPGSAPAWSRVPSATTSSADPRRPKCRTGCWPTPRSGWARYWTRSISTVWGSAAA